MDSRSIAEKLAEAEKLVESISEERRGEVRVAVLTTLLLRDNSVVPILPGIDGLTSVGAVASKFSSIRQLARITKKARMTGDRVILALASYINGKEGRRLTTTDCRKHWEVLSDKSFATTWILNAESKGWLVPVEERGERTWGVTPEGEREFLAMQRGGKDADAKGARAKVKVSEAKA